MGSEKPTKVELGMRFSCEALGECVTEKQRPDGQWQLRWLKYNCLTDFAWSDVQLLNTRNWDYLGHSSAPAAIPRVRRPKQAPPMTEAAIFAAMVERDKVRTAPQLFPAVVERGPRQSVNLSCGGVWSLRPSRLDNRGAK